MTVTKEQALTLFNSDNRDAEFDKISNADLAELSNTLSSEENNAELSSFVADKVGARIKELATNQNFELSLDELTGVESLLSSFSAPNNSEYARYVDEVRSKIDARRQVLQQEDEEQKRIQHLEEEAAKIPEDEEAVQADEASWGIDTLSAEQAEANTRFFAQLEQELAQEDSPVRKKYFQATQEEQELINALLIVDDNGNELSEEEALKHKGALFNAASLEAQTATLTGSRAQSYEEFVEDYINNSKDAFHKAVVTTAFAEQLKDKNGNYRNLSSEEIAEAYVQVAQQPQGNKIKVGSKNILNYAALAYEKVNQAKQGVYKKFGEIPMVKMLSNKISSVDKQMSEKFPKTWPIAKRIGKVLGKRAKGVLIYTAVGSTVGPLGLGVLAVKGGWDTYKGFKEKAKQNGMSFREYAKKNKFEVGVALLATSLSAIGASVGLGAGGEEMAQTITPHLKTATRTLAIGPKLLHTVVSGTKYGLQKWGLMKGDKEKTLEDLKKHSGELFDASLGMWFGSKVNDVVSSHLADQQSDSSKEEKLEDVKEEIKEEVKSEDNVVDNSHASTHHTPTHHTPTHHTPVHHTPVHHTPNEHNPEQITPNATPAIEQTVEDTNIDVNLPPVEIPEDVTIEELPETPVSEEDNYYQEIRDGMDKDEGHNSFKEEIKHDHKADGITIKEGIENYANARVEDGDWSQQQADEFSNYAQSEFDVRDENPNDGQIKDEEISGRERGAAVKDIERTLDSMADLNDNRELAENIQGEIGTEDMPHGETWHDDTKTSQFYKGMSDVIDDMQKSDNIGHVMHDVMERGDLSKEQATMMNTRWAELIKAGHTPEETLRIMEKDFDNSAKWFAAQEAAAARENANVGENVSALTETPTPGNDGQETPADNKVAETPTPGNDGQETPADNKVAETPTPGNDGQETPADNKVAETPTPGNDGQETPADNEVAETPTPGNDGQETPADNEVAETPTPGNDGQETLEVTENQEPEPKVDKDNSGKPEEQTAGTLGASQGGMEAYFPTEKVEQQYGLNNVERCEGGHRSIQAYNINGHSRTIVSGYQPFVADNGCAVLHADGSSQAIVKEGEHVSFKCTDANGAERDMSLEEAREFVDIAPVRSHDVAEQFEHLKEFANYASTKDPVAYSEWQASELGISNNVHSAVLDNGATITCGDEGITMTIPGGVSLAATEQDGKIHLSTALGGIKGERTDNLSPDILFKCAEKAGLSSSFTERYGTHLSSELGAESKVDTPQSKDTAQTTITPEMMRAKMSKDYTA